MPITKQHKIAVTYTADDITQLIMKDLNNKYPKAINSSLCAAAVDRIIYNQLDEVEVTLCLNSSTTEDNYETN